MTGRTRDELRADVPDPKTCLDLIEKSLTQKLRAAGDPGTAATIQKSLEECRAHKQSLQHSEPKPEI